MVSRRTFLALLGSGAVVAGGVAAGLTVLPGADHPSGPPMIRYGEERCAYCGMTIGDERFAAAWRCKDGREQHFDDIGCMVNASRRHDPGDGTQFYVHDFADHAWLDAASASYVVSTAIKTPMVYGVAAFARAEVAQSLSKQQQGLGYEWTSLLQSLERKG